MPKSPRIGRPKRRLSLQICRVLGIMRLLRGSDSGHPNNWQHWTARYIHARLNKQIPRTVALRTVRRDLDAMVAMGYLELHDVSLWCPLEKRIANRRWYTLGASTNLERRAIWEA